MSAHAQARHAHPRHARVVVPLVAMLAAMSGLVYYAVPLYRLFCQVTGFGGTTQRAAALPPGVGAGRTFTVRFNADIQRDLPWRFAPVRAEVRIKAGAQTLIAYRARNLSDAVTTGRASFNVTPQKAGVYFVKVACFCFTRQTLKPGQVARMPVSFYIDPAILKDRNMNGVRTITLSYTFFKARGGTEKKTAAVGGRAIR